MGAEASTAATLPAVQAPLVYGGEIIHERDETLSLTDMWTAARRKHVEDGGDAADFENRRPANWSRKEGSEFIASLQRRLNVSRGHIYQGERGAGGSTFAHWQVGLAYAKYLSADFHMWCNTVVKAHMEGQAGPTPDVVPLVTSNIRSVVADFKALFSLAKLVGLDKNQCALRANRATFEEHGVDLLGKLGQPLLEAPHQEALLRVTDVGREIGGLSARATNVALTTHGFQTCRHDAKGDIYYEPTDFGRSHSRMMDVDIDQPGASKQQLRWLTSVIEPLKAIIAERPG